MDKGVGTYGSVERLGDEVIGCEETRGAQGRAEGAGGCCAGGRFGRRQVGDGRQGTCRCGAADQEGSDAQPSCTESLTSGVAGNEEQRRRDKMGCTRGLFASWLFTFLNNACVQIGDSIQWGSNGTSRIMRVSFRIRLLMAICSTRNFQLRLFPLNSP
jgi:hypothetical protein